MNPVWFQIIHFNVRLSGTYTGYGDEDFWCSYAQSDVTDLVHWNTRFQKDVKGEDRWAVSKKGKRSQYLLYRMFCKSLLDSFWQHNDIRHVSI